MELTNLEKIGKLHINKKKLSLEDIKLIIDYLNEYFFASNMNIEYIDAPTKSSITLDYISESNIKMLVNYKSLNNVYETFQSFIHTSYHYYQYDTSSSNKTYDIMFRLFDVLSNYSKKHNYNFHKENYDTYFFEIDANLKTYKILKNNIEQEVWYFFEKDILKDVKNKYTKYQILDLLKSFNFLGDKYIPYDKYMAETIIKISKEDKELLKDDEVLNKYLDNRKDIIDYLLEYAENPFFLNRYIIVYLIEKNELMQEKILNKINELSKNQKETLKKVINEISNKVHEVETWLVLHQREISNYFTEEEAYTLDKNCQSYIRALHDRIKTIHIFLEYAEVNNILK